MKFTEKEFSELRKDVKTALADVENKFNISFHPGDCSYSATSFTMKLEAKRTDIDADRIEFEKDCILVGFKPTDYRREFVDEEETFILVGFIPRNRKNSCVVENTKSGKRFKCPSGYIKKFWPKT